MSKKQSKLEKKVRLEPSHTVKEMNDLCPYSNVRCGNPRQEYCWERFGRYTKCGYYKNRNI